METAARTAGREQAQTAPPQSAARAAGVRCGLRSPCVVVVQFNRHRTRTGTGTMKSYGLLLLLVLGVSSDASPDDEDNSAVDYAAWKTAAASSSPSLRSDKSGSDYSAADKNLLQQQPVRSSEDDESPVDDVAEPVAPSLSSNLYVLLHNRRKYNNLRGVQQQQRNNRIPTLPLEPIPRNGVFRAVYSEETPESRSIPAAGSINPTRASSRSKTLQFVDGDEAGHERFKRCFTCGGMGMGASGGDSGAASQNMVDGGGQQQFDNGNADKLLEIGSILGGGGSDFSGFGSGGGMGQNQGQVQVIIRQGGNQGGFLIGQGTQTIAGAMRTTISNGFAYTISSYTRIVNGIPTIGAVTLGPIQTYYQGKALQAGQNAFGVPNQGTYTLAGAMSTYQQNGYPMTVSSYTRIVDGAATFGAITLAGMQTQYNGRLLQNGENPFGVPNQGTYTLAGGIQTSMGSGGLVTMSTYTKIVNGVATYGTVTIGSMQTYYQGKLLAPGDNIYGVPNQGVYTLPGGMATSIINGYAMTLSTYTRVVDGLATFGTVTLGTMQTYYNNRLLKQGENAYGVPNVGTYTLQGAMSTALDQAGYPQTISTYTKVVDGVATFGTVTLGSMQTFYNGKLLQAGENAYGVPNRGVYTLAGQMSQTNINGYQATVSTYTKIVDGIATFGTVTLGGMQTYYNNKLLAPGENAYGVPNQGVYTIPGQMAVSYMSGYPMTISTYTKVVNGQATFGTITIGSMQTYYNNRLLQPNENPYGVPNVGTYTLPGPMSTVADVNGYPVTISSYTRIIDGRATFGAITQGMQVTMYQGKVLRYGENPFGVPNQGTYTLPGSMQTLRVNGIDQTMSTYTRIVNGVATYGTVTIGAMQTYFIPNQNPTPSFASSNQVQDSMRNAFVQQDSNQQNSFRQTSQSSQNRIIDSGSGLIQAFIDTGIQAQAQQQQQPQVSVQLIPTGSRSSSSQFSQTVIDVPVQNSNVRLVPVFSSPGSSSQNNRFSQAVDQLDNQFNGGSMGSSNQGSSFSSVTRIIDTSNQGGVQPMIGSGTNRFSQLVDQLSGQDMGSNSQQLSSFSSQNQGSMSSSGSGGGFLQLLDQGNQLSGSSQGTAANRFAQVLDQVSPLMQNSMPGQGGNVHRSFQIQTQTRVTGVGPCGGGKK
ncbi:hypothetical protein BV898_14390 [Hypsibius exemplaris]|uniref:Uncharacterized protein n=1 Tax=Hypsibius exemplaris TaxID=2072580 RepID=A0A9X6NC22_HYPEX|nr:hypothetical protein BV898_14390 [Hypsibius exemplaris]